MDPWNFEDVKRFLRERFPLRNYRLYIRLQEPACGEDGYTSVSRSERTITILVNPRQSLSNRIHTLLHEYAHALHLDRIEWHGRQWSRLYAECYTAWEKLSGE